MLACFKISAANSRRKEEEYKEEEGDVLVVRRGRAGVLAVRRRRVRVHGKYEETWGAGRKEEEESWGGVIRKECCGAGDEKEGW